MRSIRIAEWILELSMTRERAASVAGDLRESERGAFWYWRNVIATMIAGVWSDFLSAPWRLIAVALGVTVVISAVETLVLDFALRRSSIELYRWIAWSVNVPSMLAAGRWIARWSGRREIASWLTATVLQVVFNLVFFHVYPHAHWSPWLTAVSLSLTFLGAISARPRLMVAHA